MISITLCMIVKNEQSILERCLISYAGTYDELIIVDTGSTDSTKDIAHKYTDKVYDYKWCDDQIIVTPRQFLSVMKHAQYVVTSTYHGTVFSTLLKKKFVVIHPSIKVIDYLEQIGLKKISFLESGYDNFSKFLLDDIDYDLVWDKLNTLREFSVHCINENLNK